MSTDVITEFDILDLEAEEFSGYVECDRCTADPSPAFDMVRQLDGSWLCWPCVREYWEFSEHLHRTGYAG